MESFIASFFFVLFAFYFLEVLRIRKMTKEKRSVVDREREEYGRRILQWLGHPKSGPEFVTHERNGKNAIEEDVKKDLSKGNEDEIEKEFQMRERPKKR